jgi:hypothetical protein
MTGVSTSAVSVPLQAEISNAIIAVLNRIFFISFLLHG